MCVMMLRHHVHSELHDCNAGQACTEKVLKPLTWTASTTFLFSRSKSYGHCIVGSGPERVQQAKAVA